jgi:hypothetical protein
MTYVDIALYDFDPDSTLYCFIVNADQQVYLRYGGRDDSSAEKYLNMDSLELALERGLELHKKFGAGELAKVEKPAAKLPVEYPEIRDGPMAKKQCVHCHHMGSGKTKLLQSQGKLDRLKDLWVYPDVQRQGITLDEKKLLTVESVEGAAKDAGLRKGDEITKFEGKAVHTFGDLQQAMHLHAADSKSMKLTVKRKDAEHEFAVVLDEWWRVTDISRRSSTHALEPFAEFWGKEPDKDTKRKLGIKEDEFALEVGKFWVKTNAQNAGLQVGDVVYAVDDISKVAYTTNPTTWIRLNKNAGDTITVKVLRGGKKLEFSFKLKARAW